MVKTSQLREAALDKTIEEIPDVDEAGDNTDRLSDISENDDDLLLDRRGHTGWMDKIRPLVQKKDVRIVLIINLAFIVLNLVFFVAFVGFATYATLEYNYVGNMKKNNTPCLYMWTEWTACSASCRPPDRQMPIMTRIIQPNSVIQARGKYINIAPCPPDVRLMIDSAPCNVFDCPLNLSSFEKSQGFIDTNGSLRKMRNLPSGLSLIEIDTNDLYG